MQHASVLTVCARVDRRQIPASTSSVFSHCETEKRNRGELPRLHPGQPSQPTHKTTVPAFIACSNWPRCALIESGCRQSDVSMVRSDRYRLCCAYPPHLQWLVGCVPGSGGTTVYRARSYLDCVRGRNLIEVQRRFVTLSFGAPAARYRPPPRVATVLGRAANLQVRMVPLHPIRRSWSPRK